MAMLAEPRRKQKWTLNPRGKQWSEDSNKFGQKMLEKMGWTSGKGLGANEQGMTEHVRVSYKNDTAGIGFKLDKLDHAWTEYQEGYNNFLQELQKAQNSDLVENGEDDNVGSTTSRKSLELKSKQSRARVHYQKFTRGKDINRYSSKDLANIFGQKNLSDKPSIKDAEKEEDTSIPVGSRDNTGGIVTIHGGSITDYLKTKTFNFTKENSKNAKERCSTDEEEEQYMGFGFTPSMCNESVEKTNSQDSCTPVKVKKSSKKRKKEFAFENGALDLQNLDEDDSVNTSVAVVDSNCNEGFVNNALNIYSQVDESHNGKEFEVSRVCYGLSNNALDLTDEISNKKRVTFNDHIEYNVQSGKKKKMKVTLDKYEVESGSNKKKRKRESNENVAPVAYVNEALDIDATAEETNDNRLNEHKSKRARRSKERRMSSLETIKEAVEEGMEQNKETSIDNDTHDASNNNSFVSNEEKEKIKKKKKRDKEDIVVVDITNENESTAIQSTTQMECEQLKDMKNVNKHKSKKKKKKEEERSVNSTVIDEVVVVQEREPSDPEILMEVQEIKHDNHVIKKSKKRKKEKKEEGSQPEVVDLEMKAEKEDLTIADAKKKKKTKIENRDSQTALEKENCPGSQMDTSSTPRKKHKDSKKPKEYLAQKEKCPNKTVDTEKSIDITQDSKDQASEDTKLEVSCNGETGTENRNTRQSPWTGKVRMSKKMLKHLFQKNSISQFPGSNIHEIKGYGVDIDDNTAGY